MEKTITQFNAVVANCRSLFEKKTKDYGTAWRILRPRSITDQIFIKAQRIRTIEEAKQQLVEDSIETEFVGIINYCIMALIQLELPKDAPLEMNTDEVLSLYDHHIAENIRLLQAKNHDYGEAWRSMRISSMTDLILMKLMRVKQIEDNEGKTLVSEGLDANYRDILNYSVFALILMGKFV